MNVPYHTGRRPLTIKITVRSHKPEKMIIQVHDADKPNTLFENRYQTIVFNPKKKRYEDMFFIKMPQSPENAIISVFNSVNGNKIKDGSFDVEMKEEPLKRWLLPMSIDNSNVREFIAFAQEFSEDAGIISAGFQNNPNSIYASNDGKLKIHYYNVLRDERREIRHKPSGQMMRNPNFGRVVTTPMRTQVDTGIIEVSKQYILQYTVPMRMAILLHEFNHFYVNRRPEDETEADLGALMIFLSLGYSKIAAYKAFTAVFKNADNEGNRKRDKEIRDFIDNFENMRFSRVA